MSKCKTCKYQGQMCESIRIGKCQSYEPKGTGQEPDVAEFVNKLQAEVEMLQLYDSTDSVSPDITYTQVYKLLSIAAQLQVELEKKQELVSQWVDNHAKVHVKFVRAEQANVALQKQVEAERWIPTEDDPPDEIDWDKKVQVLECEAEIPTVMTMAEIFLDEDSEAEYWKPIILPEQALKDGKEKEVKDDKQ